MAKINVLQNAETYAAVKAAIASGDAKWNNGDEVWSIISFAEATSFPWQQRIFPPGAIIHLQGTNVRVFIEESKLK